MAFEGDEPDAKAEAASETETMNYISQHDPFT